MAMSTSLGMSESVVMVSMWRDDAGRELGRRAMHLLQKGECYEALRWVWVVGDSSDGTEGRLRAMTRAMGCEDRVTVVRFDTGIAGDDPESRIKRLSMTANRWWDEIRAEDVYCLIHESDLVSPKDVVKRLVAHAEAGRCPAAGWPVLKLGASWVFYDTYAYRRDGVHFSNWPPFHACYRAGEVFEVDSVGSLWLMWAEDVRGPQGVRCERRGAVDLCAGMKARGRRIWVDSTLVIVQPEGLWKPQVAPAE